MNKKAVLTKIESYLNGEINAEDFSYDFPVTYSFYAQKLDKESQGSLPRLRSLRLLQYGGRKSAQRGRIPHRNPGPLR